MPMTFYHFSIEITLDDNESSRDMSSPTNDSIKKEFIIRILLQKEKKDSNENDEK